MGLVHRVTSRFVAQSLVGGGIIGGRSIAVFITRGLVFILVLVILLVPTPREDCKDVEGSSVLVARSTGLAVLVARRGIVTDRGSITVARLLVLVLVVLILIFVTEGPSAGTVRGSIPRAGSSVSGTGGTVPIALGSVTIAWGSVTIARSSITCAWGGIIVRGGW